MWAVFDPLQFLKGSSVLQLFTNCARSTEVRLHAFEMGVHWNELRIFFDRLEEDGALMQGRGISGQIFGSEMPHIAKWREKKYGPRDHEFVHLPLGSEIKGLYVDKLFEAEETDPLMPLYHTCIAQGIDKKFWVSILLPVLMF